LFRLTVLGHGLLRQAVAAGYEDATHMKSDRDLDALHERDDFKALLRELETEARDRPKGQE
jgi:hypothetical protein